MPNPNLENLYHVYCLPHYTTEFIINYYIASYIDINVHDECMEIFQ